MHAQRIECERRSAYEQAAWKGRNKCRIARTTRTTTRRITKTRTTNAMRSIKIPSVITTKTIKTNIRTTTKARRTLACDTPWTEDEAGERKRR